MPDIVKVEGHVSNKRDDQAKRAASTGKHNQARILYRPLARVSLQYRWPSIVTQHVPLA